MQSDLSLIESILWASNPFWPPYCPQGPDSAQHRANGPKAPDVTDFVFGSERLQACSGQVTDCSWKERFFLFSRHMERLSESASHFGFCFDQDTIISELERTANRLYSKYCSHRTVSFPHQYKVRLVLSPSGRVAVDHMPISPVDRLPVWFDISDCPSEQKTPYPAHKTSLRRVFDMEFKRATSQGLFDTVFIDSTGQVTEGTFTNVFVDMGDGMLVTPPSNAGLLPGTLRAELLFLGLAIQAVVSITMLEKARRVYLGNSVRGLLPARLKSMKVV